MIDISMKRSVLRIARASGKIFLEKGTVERIKNNDLEKGDALTIARVAAMTAVKRVPELIPFCHPIPISSISIDFNFESERILKVTCTVKSKAPTGVEMEALMGVSVALLNIWDVVKKYEKDDKGQYPFTIISDIKVEEKIKQD